MFIAGVTVSVDYADILAQGLETWRDGLDFLMVVTTHRDQETARLCERAGVHYLATEAFYRGDAVFNKGLALSEVLGPALGAHPFHDWILGFDADIVPPVGWRHQVDTAALEPGNLYGVTRRLQNGQTYPEAEIAGFFQLWHTSDPQVARRPLYETTWRHAGGYDSEFQGRWGQGKRWRLPFEVEHVGVPGTNWWGRGNVRAMADMIRARQAEGVVATAEEFTNGVPETALGARGYRVGTPRPRA